MKKVQDLNKKKQGLHQLFLELSWTVGIRKDQISDLESDLKEAKKHLKTDEKLLNDVKAHYKEIFGSEPRNPRS